MSKRVVDPDPTFQCAHIRTYEKPSWDELRDKMKYVIREKRLSTTSRQVYYLVFAYAKVATRKRGWQNLFGSKKQHTVPIRGKFEDYGPYQSTKSRLSQSPGQIQEWGVCPSLRGRPNMLAKRQALNEVEQLRNENRQLRAKIQRLQGDMATLRKSKRKAGDMSAEEAEEADEAEEAEEADEAEEDKEAEEAEEADEAEETDEAEEADEAEEDEEAEEADEAEEDEEAEVFIGGHPEDHPFVTELLKLRRTKHCAHSVSTCARFGRKDWSQLTPGARYCNHKKRKNMPARVRLGVDSKCWINSLMLSKRAHLAQ
jgi:flagellar biosynthesis GTPase FlhF